MKLRKYSIPWNSIRFKLILGLFAVMIPLISLLIYDNFYAIKVIHNQVAESNKNMISLYMSQIDKELENTDTYLSRLALTDDNFKLMSYTNNEDDYYLAQFRLSKRISEDVLMSKNTDSVFIYNAKRDSLIEGFNEGSTFAEREKVRDYIRNTLKSNSGAPTKGWSVKKIDKEYYLFRILKVDNVYVGAWISAKKILIPLKLINLGENGASMLITDSGEPMITSKLINDEKIDLNHDLQNYYLTGKNNNYLTVGEKSAKGDFKLIALIPNEEILEKLPFLQRVAAFIAVGAVLLLPICLIFLRNVLLVPLKRILKAMKRIHEGNLDFRIERYNTSDEFIMVNETFNKMIDQIHDLRISVYEEQLSKQKMELQHLQLQVNPHFFLNSLNIIYSLAQTKKYELIQEMTLSLVKYFRYMFRSNMELVFLKEELQHVKNYIHIQKLRFPNSLTYEIEAEENLLEVQVPPLVVQNFVENSVKYGVTLDESIHISVKVINYVYQQKQFMKIIISDTGRGFPDDILQELRAGHRLASNEGKHIGVWNVQRRLELLYGQEASIKFFNNENSKGAFVEILLPVKQID
ncbi:histidine kinase [Clostridium sp. SYSU_GA19001]|uniref:cache domain-containing sensor histidine kinase n=1 Tax=Clostridium caldaquaticum TaxID=2940653 RepID=UPI0020774D8A|nr:sensor histidine kinase [Clostridium caldaquaticum]MCM8710333.1 histidine kinase [Clostridium caldaquaticum]